MPLRDLFYFFFPFLRPWPDERTFEYQVAIPLLQEEPTLTPREVDVAWCIRAGLSNEEIAGELNISVSTVKTHVHNLLLKFRVRSRWTLQAILEERWEESEGHPWGDNR
jgi:DNA-binding NarL/FixJ family response regulator